MYYLYKLFLKGTPKYYVGITNDPARRKMGHHSAVNIAIQDIKNGSRLSRTDYRFIMATHIISTDKSKWGKWTHCAALHISFKVIMEITTLEEAKAVETRYLSRRGKHCLNKIGKSYYRGGGPKYSEQYAYVCNQMSKSAVPC